MNYIDELLEELTSRLPELEWKISRLNSYISSKSLPRGLFRTSVELTGLGCVDEIKKDIEALAHQDNERSAYYLATRIKQKVNVLVALCQIEGRKNKGEEKVHFGLTMLNTRQQWIESLEKEINTLQKQQQAMTKALAQMKRSPDTQAVLSVQKELGEIERRLTLATETLNQTI